MGLIEKRTWGGNHSHPTFEQHPLNLRLVNLRVLDSVATSIPLQHDVIKTVGS